MRVNNWSLGIELVNTQNVQNYNDPFSEWQIRMTALIVRYAWSKYPNLRYVASHAKLDPGRRSDPGSNFPWDRFQDLVLRSDIEPPRNMLIAKSRDLPPLPEGHLGGCCP
jgi:N-acetylmuramoyl-L-alanine amidase